jgi:hypothetical protein
MSRASHSLPSLFFAFGGPLILCAPAAADPVYANGSAQSVIDELKANGHNVVINWLTGTTPSRFRSAGRVAPAGLVVPD